MPGKEQVYQVNFHFDLYETCVEEVLSEKVQSGILTENDIPLVRVITLKQGIRFLTDHISEDVYYQATRQDKNLDRARTWCW